MFGLKIFVRVQTFRRMPPVLPRNFCHPDWQVPWKRMFSFGHYPNSLPLFLAMSRDHWVLCNVHFTMFPPWIGLYFVFFYWECLVHLCLPVLVYILYFYWECIVHLCPPVLVDFFLYFYIENTLCILSDYWSLVRAPPTAQAWLTSLHSLVTLMIRRAWLDLQKSLLFQNLLSSAKSP